MNFLIIKGNATPKLPFAIAIKDDHPFTFCWSLGELEMHQRNFLVQTQRGQQLNTLGVSGALRAIGGKACSSKDGEGERDSERADDGQQAA